MGVTAIYANMRQKVLDRVPPRVWRRLRPQGVVSLYYHMVSDRVLPHMATTPLYKNPDQFEADVCWLQREGTIVDHDAVAAYVEDGNAPPPNAYHITFDDGFREWYDVVRPILLRHDARATFFVPTDFIDNRALNWVHLRSICFDHALRAGEDHITRAMGVLNTACDLHLSKRRALCDWIRNLRQHQQRELAIVSAQFEVDAAQYLADYRPYLTTAQIRQLADEGFTIGAHSLRHYILGDLGDDDAVRREIVESCRIIRDITGAARVPFAFPFYGDRVDRGLLADLRRQHGFIGLYFDAHKFRRDIPDVVHRVPADWPKNGRPGESNLPFMIGRAYSNPS